MVDSWVPGGEGKGGGVVHMGEGVDGGGRRWWSVGAYDIDDGWKGFAASRDQE